MAFFKKVTSEAPEGTITVSTTVTDYIYMSHIQHTLYFLSKYLPPSHAPHGVLCWRCIVFGSVLLTVVTWINFTLPVPPPLFVNEFVTRCLSPFHRSPPSPVFFFARLFDFFGYYGKTKRRMQ